MTISKLDFDTEELVDPMEQTWKDSIKPQNFLDTWTKRAFAAVFAIIAFVVVVAAFVPDSSSYIYDESPQWKQFDSMFSFGDSYTSYLRSERYEDPPWECKKLGEEGRYRSKPNWITFISEYYNKTQMRTVDFAVGGSTVDGKIIPPFAMGSSLKDEVNDFQASYGAGTAVPGFEWEPKRTLFTFWFGVNDITITNSRSDPDAEPPTFERPPLDAMFESYMRSLNTLYDAGARNFLVLTCPPFERSIIDISTPAWSQRHLNFITDISSFNARIFDMVFAFRANHTDAHTSIFDAHRLFAAVLERPHQFEPTIAVTNTTGVCHEADEEDQPGPIDIVYERNICRGGELIQSFAWTSLHATYPMHNATAAQIVKDCFGGDGNGEYCHA